MGKFLDDDAADLPPLPKLEKSLVGFLQPAELSQTAPAIRPDEAAIKADELLADPHNEGLVHVTHCSHGSHGSHGQW